MRFVIFMVMSMKMAVFWNVATCSQVEVGYKLTGVSEELTASISGVLFKVDNRQQWHSCQHKFLDTIVNSTFCSEI